LPYPREAFVAVVEVVVDEVDIGSVTVIEGYADLRHYGPARHLGPRLLIQARDGTTVLADATAEQIDLLSMVWAATTDENERETLADLRAAYAAMKARHDAPHN
jgi:hypothetical protein